MEEGTETEVSQDAGTFPNTPESILSRLKSSPNTPENTAASVESRDLFSKYQSEERAVHSYTSLEKSREYVMKILDHLPEYNKIVMSELAVKQEIQLQESIRLQSYSDSELTSRTRRNLTIGLALSTILLFVVVTLSFVGAGIWGWKFETEKFKAICWVLGGSFAGWVGTIVTYYYRPRR